MVGDLGCYGLHSNGEFADISSLEPSIYPQQMIAEEAPFGAGHQNGYPSATLPIVPSGQTLYRPVSFNNSPTGSSQASTGSEEGEEFVSNFVVASVTFSLMLGSFQYANWHPYKRSPPNASLMMASAVGGELLDCKKRGGKATKKRKPKKDPNEPQKCVIMECFSSKQVRCVCANLGQCRLTRSSFGTRRRRSRVRIRTPASARCQRSWRRCGTDSMLKPKMYFVIKFFITSNITIILLELQAEDRSGEERLSQAAGCVPSESDLSGKRRKKPWRTAAN